MLTKISAVSQNNYNKKSYKPAFGSTGNVTNSLSKLLKRHEDVAPALRELKEGIKNLNANGLLDHVSVNVETYGKLSNLFRRYIRLNCEITNGEGGVVTKNVDLFRYKWLKAEVVPQDILKDKKDATGVLAAIHDNAITDPSTAVDIQLPKNSLYLQHKDLNPYFEAGDKAFDEIIEKQTEGLFNVKYKIKKLGLFGKKGKSLEIRYNLENSAFGPKLKKKDNSGSIKICTLDKDQNVTFNDELGTPADFKAKLIKEFDELYKKVNNSIIARNNEEK